MNYATALVPLCSCCGGPVPVEPIEGDTEGVCLTCFADSQAKAQAAQRAQAVSDFRWFAREWFRGAAERERYRWAEGYFGFQPRVAT